MGKKLLQFSCALTQKHPTKSRQKLGCVLCLGTRSTRVNTVSTVVSCGDLSEIIGGEVPLVLSW